MNKLMVIVAVATSVFLTACGKSDPGSSTNFGSLKTPEEIALALYETYKSGDEKASLKLIDSEILKQEHLAGWPKAFAMIRQTYEACGGLERVEVVKTTYTEDQKYARVETKLFFKDCKPKPDSLRFAKQNEYWVVNLNAGAPMSFGKHIGKY